MIFKKCLSKSFVILIFLVQASSGLALTKIGRSEIISLTQLRNQGLGSIYLYDHYYQYRIDVSCNRLNKNEVTQAFAIAFTKDYYKHLVKNGFLVKSVAMKSPNRSRSFRRDQIITYARFLRVEVTMTDGTLLYGVPESNIYLENEKIVGTSYIGVEMKNGRIRNYDRYGEELSSTDVCMLRSNWYSIALINPRTGVIISQNWKYN